MSINKPKTEQELKELAKFNMTEEQSDLGDKLVKGFFLILFLFFGSITIFAHCNPRPYTNPYEFKVEDFKDKDGNFPNY